MKVISAAGEFDLGVTEATPTISIRDYSRRETDDFGETTVVPRGFSRKLSVKLLVPSDRVDAIQQHLASLRAQEATWQADAESEWLSPTGFFRDFEIDLAVPPTSFCTLSIEGLAETEIAPDPGGDPAPVGSTSSLRLIDGSATFALGLTEASPTVGIIDYSRKDVDDFGEPDIVKRAWAKRMSVQALIRTDMIDVVANRLAAVRARPVLWQADAQFQSLQIEGFFKEFSIERGENVSKLSLSIEGISQAAPAGHGGISWVDIVDTDPARPKPEDGATVGAPAGTPVAGTPAEELVGSVKGQALAALRSRAAIEIARLRDRARLFAGPEGETAYTLLRREEAARADQDSAFAQTFALIGAVTPDGRAFILAADTVEVGDGVTFAQTLDIIAANSASITETREVLYGPDGAAARALLELDVDGRIVGRTITNDGEFGRAVFAVDAFDLVDPDTGDVYFTVGDDGVARLKRVEVDTLAANSVEGFNLDLGSMGKGGIFHRSEAVSVSSTTEWTDLAATQIIPRYGKPLQVSFSCFAKANTASTPNLLRVILDDGTPIWGSSAGERTRTEDEGRTVAFTCGCGSIPGRPTTVRVQVKALNDETVQFLHRYLRVEELSRVEFDSFDMGSGPGTPTDGAGGGGGSGGVPYDPNRRVDYEHQEIQP